MSATLTEEQAAAVIHRSPAYLERLRRHNSGPACRHSSGEVVYDRSGLETWWREGNALQVRIADLVMDGRLSSSDEYEEVLRIVGSVEWKKGGPSFPELIIVALELRSSPLMREVARVMRAERIDHDWHRERYGPHATYGVAAGVRRVKRILAEREGRAA